MDSRATGTRTGPSAETNDADGPEGGSGARPGLGPSRHAAVRVVGVLLVAVVVAGVLATFARPVAPAVGEQLPVARFLDDEVRAQIDAYRAPLYVVGPVNVLLGAVGPLAVVMAVTAGMAGMAGMAGGGARTRRRRRGAGDRASRRPVRTAALVGIAVAAVSALLKLPAGFWAGFLHARAYGLRTQTAAGWFGDLALAAIPRWLVIGALAALVVALVRRSPRHWPLWLAGSVVVASAAVVVLWPLVVEPLRFDLRPLAAGPTHTAVGEVLDRADLDAPVYVADASRRTTARNAYVSGMGATRHIVLYDTLLDLPAEEVAAIVAHEVAHALHADVLRGWLAGAASATVGIVGVGYVAQALARRRGVDLATRVAQPRTAAFVVAAALLVEAAVVPALAWQSRRVESAADATALELLGDGTAVVALQRSLVSTNLSDPDPPAWWVWWRATHPDPQERLTRAARAGELQP